MIEDVHPGSGFRIRIPDPDPDFLHIPDPRSGVKKATDPGSESARLVLRYRYFIKIILAFCLISSVFLFWTGRCLPLGDSDC
jgi:hypothetical protein